MFTHHTSHKRQRTSPQDTPYYSVGMDAGAVSPYDATFLQFQVDTDFEANASLWPQPFMETTQEVSSHAIESHSPNCGVNRLQLSNSVDASLDVEQCIISPLGETSSTKATVEEASIKPALFSHLPQLDSTETTQALVPHSLSQIKVARKTCIPEQTSPMSNRPTSIPTTHDQQIIQDANRTFAKLLPLLEKVTKVEFEPFLVEVLKECPRVSMDDLYNLFYNEKTPELLTRCDDPGGLRKKELRLCHLVVETFQNTKLPESVSATGLQTRLPSAVNFHEFLRTFLAVKILSETLERVDIFASPGQESVPRISIYKVYYILCQKLISKYPNVSDSLSLQQNIILGQSKFGKLFRSVFPDLPMKRLGRRGESRPHYLGIKWNEAIVGEEILRLIDLEVPEIQDTFNDSRKYRNTLVRRRKLASCTKEIREQKHEHPEQENRSKDEQKHKSAVEPHSAYQKPVYSFVTFSCKYPSFDCSPRVWKSMRNSTSQQSKWAKDTMNHSSSFLKRHHVDLDPLIENFHRGIYSDNSASGLSNTMVGALKTLVASSACTEAYMHLYLAILLLVFPVILASDQDVTVTLKAQLQESIQNCIAKMDGESSSLAKVDKDNLKTYTGVLGKMIRLSEMTNTKVRGISPEHVLEEISKDVTDAGRSSMDMKSNPLSLDGRYLRVAILAFNAYGFDINEGNRGERKSTTDAAMLAISRKFTHATKAFSEKIQDIPIWAKFNGLTGVAPTIPHQMFTIGVEIFHVTSLMDATVAKLPIPMLNMMLAQILNEVQTSSFEEFRNRDSGLSTEVFKSWWVFSIMFQEYLGIMGEVVALSQRLK